MMGMLFFFISAILSPVLGLIAGLFTKDIKRAKQCPKCAQRIHEDAKMSMSRLVDTRPEITASFLISKTKKRIRVLPPGPQLFGKNCCYENGFGPIIICCDGGYFRSKGSR